MSSEKIKLVPVKRSKGEYEYDKKVLKGVVQGSIILNKAFGKMTAHFHFMGTAGGSEITIKEGDKIILEGIKINKTTKIPIKTRMSSIKKCK